MAIPGPAVQLSPIEVQVTHSFEDALRRFKKLVQDEKIISQIKAKMEYEKPSERKRRKRRESAERQMLSDMREKLIKSGEWDKRKKKNEARKAEKIEKRIKRQEDITY